MLILLTLHYRTWAEWTGSAQLTKMLARKYEIRKVACYKGVNVCPDVFKYVTLIEFLMYDGMYFKLFGPWKINWRFFYLGL